MFKCFISKILLILAISTVSLIASFNFYGNNVKANEDKEETKLYICNCPGGCLCEYETTKSGGRCVCGLITIPSDREPNDELEYECACGVVCDCNSRADEEGSCHCGYTPMKPVE